MIKQPHVRPARPEDAFELGPKLRQADLEEIRATVGASAPPSLILLGCLSASRIRLTLTGDSGEVLALLGVSDTEEPDVGGVWLLASDALTDPRYVKKFLRGSRQVVEQLNAAYPLLWNYVDERNKAHIRWLRWLGFVFLRRIPEHGAERRPFIEFARTGERPCAWSQQRSLSRLLRSARPGRA